MSYLHNPYTGTPSSSDAPPAKRRRGRPRKDQNAEKPSPTPAILATSPVIQSSCTTAVDAQRIAAASRLLQPVVATATATTTNNKGKGSDIPGFTPVTGGATENNNNTNDLVGQVVTGRVDGSFDAGFFLSVKVGVGENEKYRGVVFQPGKFVPVTPQNDVAPMAKMHTRMDLHVPPVNSHGFRTPPIPVQPHHSYSSSAAATSVENVVNHHQMTPREVNNDKAASHQTPTTALEKQDVEASIAIQLLKNKVPFQASSSSGTGSGSSTAMLVENVKHLQQQQQPALVQVGGTGNQGGGVIASQPNNNDNSTLLLVQTQDDAMASFTIEMENNDDTQAPSAETEVVVMNLETVTRQESDKDAPPQGEKTMTVVEKQESEIPILCQVSVDAVTQQFNSEPTLVKMEKDDDVTETNKEKVDDGDSAFDNSNNPQLVIEKDNIELAVGVSEGKQTLEIFAKDSEPNKSPKDALDPSISQSVEERVPSQNIVILPPPQHEVVNIQPEQNEEINMFSIQSHHWEKEASLVAALNEKKDEDTKTTTATVFSLIPESLETGNQKESPRPQDVLTVQIKKEEDKDIPFLPPLPPTENDQSVGKELSGPPLEILKTSDAINTDESCSIITPMVGGTTEKEASKGTTPLSASTQNQIEAILPEEDQAKCGVEKVDHHHSSEGTIKAESSICSKDVESSVTVIKEEESSSHEQLSNDVVGRIKPMDCE